MLTKKTIRVKNFDGKTVTREYLEEQIGSRADTIIYAFHGATQKPEELADKLRLTAYLDNVKIVYLRGTPSSVLPQRYLGGFWIWAKYEAGEGWNSGPNMGSVLKLSHVNESAFFDAVRKAVNPAGNIPCLLLGYSNGSMLAGSLAWALKIPAILIAGVPESYGKAAVQDPPWLAIHGSHDGNAPVLGGFSYAELVQYPHISEFVMWKARWGLAYFNLPVPEDGRYQLADRKDLFWLRDGKDHFTVFDHETRQQIADFVTGLS